MGKTVSEYAIIRWDDVRIDPGNNYDKVTGAYTAPYDGYYQFSITIRSQDRSYSEYRISVESNQFTIVGVILVMAHMGRRAVQ